MNFRFFIGIDPGVSGGIAVLDLYPERGGLSGNQAWDTPTLTIPDSKGKPKRHINIQGVVQLLKPYADTKQATVGIEKAQSMPGQGVVGMFNYGMSFGILQGVMAALNLPYTLIAPVTWKRQMCPDMGRDKSYAVARACQLFPDMKDLFVNIKSETTQKIFDGRAEAMLIAEYSRRIYMPTELVVTKPTPVIVDTDKLNSKIKKIVKA